MLLEDFLLRALFVYLSWWRFRNAFLPLLHASSTSLLPVSERLGLGLPRKRLKFMIWHNLQLAPPSFGGAECSVGAANVRRRQNTKKPSLFCCPSLPQLIICGYQNYKHRFLMQNALNSNAAVFSQKRHCSTSLLI